ncbi:MAG: hypothetical protein WCJ64_03445 [Rhodospirillaceae bacterium]
MSARSNSSAPSQMARAKPTKEKKLETKSKVADWEDRLKAADKLDEWANNLTPTQFRVIHYIWTNSIRHGHEELWASVRDMMRGGKTSYNKLVITKINMRERYLRQIIGELEAMGVLTLRMHTPTQPNYRINLDAKVGSPAPPESKSGATRQEDADALSGADHTPWSIAQGTPGQMTIPPLVNSAGGPWSNDQSLREYIHKGIPKTHTETRAGEPSVRPATGEPVPGETEEVSPDKTENFTENFEITTPAKNPATVTNFSSTKRHAEFESDLALVPSAAEQSSSVEAATLKNSPAASVARPRFRPTSGVPEPFMPPSAAPAPVVNEVQKVKEDKAIARCSVPGLRVIWDRTRAERYAHTTTEDNPFQTSPPWGEKERGQVKGMRETWNQMNTGILFQEFFEWSLINWKTVIDRRAKTMSNAPLYPQLWFLIRFWKDKFYETFLDLRISSWLSGLGHTEEAQLARLLALGLTREVAQYEIEHARTKEASGRGDMAHLEQLWKVYHEAQAELDRQRTKLHVERARANRQSAEASALTGRTVNNAFEGTVQIAPTPVISYEE